MRAPVIIGCVVVAVLLVVLGVRYWPEIGQPVQPDTVPIADPGPSQGPGAPQGGGRNRGPGGFGGFGGFVQGQDLMGEAIATLGELNLNLDFTLSREQKEKLQAIRDAAKQAQENWRKQHEEDLKKLSDDLRKARETPGGRGQFGELAARRQELYATAPKIDDAIQQIMSLLTEDQRKAFESRQAEKKAAAEEMRRQTDQRIGGGGGGGGGGGRGNRTPGQRQQQDSAPKEQAPKAGA